MTVPSPIAAPAEDVARVLLDLIETTEALLDLAGRPLPRVLSVNVAAIREQVMTARAVADDLARAS